MSNLEVISIPFLDSEASSRTIVSAESLTTLPSLDLAQRQLVTWLTLPLAAEALTTLTWEPQQAELEGRGEERALPRERASEYLAETFAKFKKQMRAGISDPPHVHAAFDPAEPAVLQWLIPVGTGTPNYILGQTTATISEPIQHRGRKLTMSAKLNKSVSNQLRTTTLRVPRTNDTQSSDTIVRLKDPHGKGAAAMRRQWSSSY